ncbi:MAG: hypothetical protein Q9196_001182, partial [Gyalolechia fulgens]
MMVDYCRGYPAIRGWQLHVWLNELNEKKVQVVRVAHRKAQQEEAWQAEIAQHGEEEARRRRAEDFDVRRDVNDDIATSEVEAQLEEEMADNPDLHVQTNIRVDKRLVWQKGQKKTKLADFNVEEYEAMVQEHLDILGAELVTLVAYIKAHHSKATWVPQSFEDFAQEEWNSVVEVIQDQSAMWKYEVTLKIEVTAKKTAAAAAAAAERLAVERLTKRSHDVLSSDPVECSPTPKPKKKTRTDKLLDEARNRAEGLIEAGSHDKALVDRWQCRDEHCTNNKNAKGFCFVDYSGKHYAIDVVQHIMWAKAMANRDPGVSIERPPADLYNYWVDKQGNVTQTSRRAVQYHERVAAKAEREEGKDFMTTFT